MLAFSVVSKFLYLVRSTFLKVILLTKNEKKHNDSTISKVKTLQNSKIDLLVCLCKHRGQIIVGFQLPLQKFLLYHRIHINILSYWGYQSALDSSAATSLLSFIE